MSLPARVWLPIVSCVRWPSKSTFLQLYSPALPPWHLVASWILYRPGSNRPASCFCWKFDVLSPMTTGILLCLFGFASRTESLLCTASAAPASASADSIVALMAGGDEGHGEGCARGRDNRVLSDAS